MALIKCSECGQMMSDKATCCPNCGNHNMTVHVKFKKNNEYKWIVLAVVILALSIGGYYIYSLSTYSNVNIEKKESDKLHTINKEETNIQELEGKKVEIALHEKELETQREEVMKQQEQEKWQRWLEGKWIRADIDPTLIEVVYYVFTFRGDGYNFTYGSEYTYNSTDKLYPYHVENNTIYSAENKALLRIDESSVKLISCDNSEEIYSKK